MEIIRSQKLQVTVIDKYKDNSILQQDHVVTGTVTAVTEIESQIGDSLAAAVAAPPRAEKEQQRRQARREKERLRKQRQRERRAKAAQAAALAEAERLEAEAKDRDRRDEKLAPAVLRAPIMAPALNPTSWRPDGRPETMLVGSRVQIVDGRPVRAFGLTAEDDPVVNLAGKNNSITARHTDAARQLQLDWEDVGSGLGLGAVDYLRTGGGGGSGAINQAMLDQAMVRARLDGAMAHVGAFAPVLARVVLDCVPVYVWAAETGKDMTQAIAWLVCALDRLVGFYNPERQLARVLGIRTVAPSRASYAVDLPQLDAASDA